MDQAPDPIRGPLDQAYDELESATNALIDARKAAFDANEAVVKAKIGFRQVEIEQILAGIRGSNAEIRAAELESRLSGVIFGVQEAEHHLAHRRAELEVAKDRHQLARYRLEAVMAGVSAPSPIGIAYFDPKDGS